MPPVPKMEHRVDAASTSAVRKVPLSVVVIAKNEERNINACLESVNWADEIILVDDESTDQTVSSAQKYTRKIFHRKMEVEGTHRNFAYAQATQDWVLSLDADERVSPELKLELEKVIQENNPAIAAYSIPVKTFIGTRWIKAAGYYPARKLRLFRKGTFRYEEANVHPRAFLEGKEKPLNADILHYGFRDISHFISKLNNQTTLEAQKWITDGRKVSLPRIFFKAWERFFKNYVTKKGYADGFLGFFMSLCHSLYQLFTYAKYWEIKTDKK